MLAVVRPSPLRLWGFLLTAAGGALVAFGSIGSWAAVALGGSTLNAVPTNGIDVWQGKVTVILGLIIVVAILALRFVRPDRRKAVAIGITVAAIASLGVAVWCVTSLSSITHDIGVDALTKHVSDVLGITLEQARQRVVATLQQKGIDVRAQTGVWLVLAGSVLATAGGLFDLAWVHQKRLAGNAIDPDTFPAKTSDDA